MREETLLSLAGAPLTLLPATAEALVLQAGATFRTTVVVKNEGSVSLVTTSEHPLHLAYRWQDEFGTVIERDGDRSRVPAPLDPDSAETVELRARAPSSEGRYRLVVSLVLEGVHWACDVPSNATVVLDARVRAAAEWPADLESSIGGRALRGAITANSLARRLIERPLDVTAEAAATAAMPLKSRPPVRKRPLERQRPTRPSLARRIRAWIRHFLGLPEMREAIEALLQRSADQQQQLTHVSAELAAISLMRQELAEYVSAVERRFESQRTTIEDLRATVDELRGTIAKQQAGVTRSTSEVRALAKTVTAARSDLLSELRAGDFVLETARRLRSLEPLVERSGDLKLLRTINDAVGRLPAVLVEEAELVSTRIADEFRGSDVVVELTSSLRQLAEWAEQASDIRLIGSIHEAIKLIPGVIAQEAELAGRHVADELREGQVVVELISSLRQLAEWAEQASDIRLIGSVHDAMKVLPGVIAHEAELAGRRVADELREGPVVVELISDLRRLAHWAEQAGDLTLVRTISERVRELSGQVESTSVHQGASLDRLQIHASSTSAKLDALMSRETIPVPGAGLVLSRNSFGFLAIQDEDLPAIAYYSSGELPERGTVSLMERLLRPGDTFVDVGANVGAYTLLGGRKVGPSGRVIAIEPLPSTSRMLGLTVAINGLSDVVELHQCALGAQAGRATIYAGVTSGHSSMIHFDELGDEFDVEVKTGASVLGRRKPRLIKIDVEGSELDVLEGLGAFVQASASVALIVECSPVHIRRSGLSVEQWIERLRSLNKDIWVIENDPPALRPLSNAGPIGDGGANLFVSRKLLSALTSMLV